MLTLILHTIWLILVYLFWLSVGYSFAYALCFMLVYLLWRERAKEADEESFLDAPYYKVVIAVLVTAILGYIAVRILAARTGSPEVSERCFFDSPDDARSRCSALPAHSPLCSVARQGIDQRRLRDVRDCGRTGHRDHGISGPRHVQCGQRVPPPRAELLRGAARLR